MGQNCNSFLKLLFCRTFFYIYISAFTFLKFQRSPNKRNSHPPTHASSHTFSSAVTLLGEWLWALKSLLPLPLLRRFVVEASILAFIWTEPCGDGSIKYLWRRRMETSNSTCLLPAHAQAHSAVGRRSSLAANRPKTLIYSPSMQL